MGMTVYVDESGNGGLLDKGQPVFTLSAIAIEEEEARRLREEYLPQKLIGQGELKHDSLSKRLRNGVQKRLGDLQEVMLRDHLAYSYVFVKLFYLIEKMMMDCTPGEDMRCVFIQRDAMTLYGQYGEINTKCDFEKVLKAYDRAIGLEVKDERFQESFDKFVAEVNTAIRNYPPLRHFLGGIASRDKDCVKEFKDNTGRNVHAPTLIGLINELFKADPSDIRIICDDSPQFEGVEKVFNGVPLSEHIRDLRKGVSDECYGLQLADLLAGGARYVGEKRMLGLDHGDKLNGYVCRLETAYDENNRLLCQPPAFPIPMFARISEISNWCRT